MSISIIVAIAQNHAIGKNNDLLWHISGDLKRFKQITSGKAIIMGRRTFFSLPNGALPNRRNIVITDCDTDCCPGAEIVSSIEEAVSLFDTENENFIIGGGLIYKQFMPLADKIYLTVVHRDYDADVFFPEIDYNKWNVEIESEHPEHDPPFSYLILTKK